MASQQEYDAKHDAWVYDDVLAIVRGALNRLRPEQQKRLLQEIARYSEHG